MHPSSSSSSSSHVIHHHPDPNWLAFSLCNNHNNNDNNSAPTPFSLFRPFDPITEEEPPPPHPTSASHLSILSGSVPEFSNFLGIVPLSSTPRFPPPPPTEQVPSTEMYDASDLKTITASFLRGFSGDVSRDRECQPQQQELQLLASESQQQQQQTGKKAADTLGQRTSIYRGVTR